MRILHITEQLNERGGACRYLLDLIQAQMQEGYQLQLALGQLAPGEKPACPLITIPSLAPDQAESPGASLDKLLLQNPADVIHLHNVMNPQVLEWATGCRAMISLQDHRSFCPGQGKLTAEDKVCSQPLASSTCNPCFESQHYFQTILQTTQARLSAIKRIRQIHVLSNYMKNELRARGCQRFSHFCNSTFCSRTQFPCESRWIPMPSFRWTFDTSQRGLRCCRRMEKSWIFSPPCICWDGTGKSQAGSKRIRSFGLGFTCKNGFRLPKSAGASLPTTLARALWNCWNRSTVYGNPRRYLGERRH